MLPNTSNKRGDRRARQNKSSGNRTINGSNSVDRIFAASHHSASSGDVLMVQQDFSRRKPSWQLTQNPPRNFMNSIHWVQSNTDGGITVSATVPTYFGLAPTISLFPTPNSLCAYFDQYCIYSVVVRLCPQYGPGQATYLGTCVTALDYDSVTALGTYAQYLDFSNADECTVLGGKSIERYFKPTVATEVYTGSVAGAYGIDRRWIDSASTTIPHYGYRAAFTGNTSTLVMTYSVSAIFGFRNNF